MRIVTTGAGAIAASFSLAAGAQAQGHQAQGYYGRIDAGVTFDAAEDATPSGMGAQPLDFGAFDDGSSLHGAVGFDAEGPLRIEFEVSHRDTTFSGDGGALISGESSVVATMVNSLVDIRLGALTPYFGAGVGVAMGESQAQIADVSGTAQVSDDMMAPAVQALAGVGVRLTDRLAADVGYRYFLATDTTRRIDQTSGLEKTYTDYEYQGVTAGLRWAFSPVLKPHPLSQREPITTYATAEEATAPAQVTPPAETICQAAEFVVYFELGEAALSQRAQERITQAVDAAKACRVEMADVVGHADRLGSAGFNQTLSEARASMVREALVRAGLNADSVVTRGLGEREPAAPTGDGVAEAANRRATVVIRFK